MALRRVRSQANEGSGARDALNPVNGYRGQIQRKGHQLKDHAKENRMRLREKQQRLQLQKEEKAARAEMSSFKMQRFKDVKSKIITYSDNRPPQDRPERNQHHQRPTSASSRFSSSPSQTPRLPTPIRNKMKPPVPRSNELLEMAPRNNTNFLYSNAMDAISGRPPPSPPLNGVDTMPKTHKNYGKVPNYLEERKMELAQAELHRLDKMDDPSAPQGMKLMDEEERRETLRVLKESLEHAKNQLFKLPLTLETPSQLKKKTIIETKMREIEDAISLFSRPKVYVAK